MSKRLPVPVEVDADSGVWSVDGLPVILIPRHYWVQIMQEVEAKVGLDAASDLYFTGTYKAAYYWCETEAETHGLSGVDVFSHYLKRMSQRGWGQFAVERIDPAAGTAQLLVHHSATALAYGPKFGRSVCHGFNGAFCGGMEYVAAHAGAPMKLSSRETECAADGARHCVFEVTPVTSRS